MRGAVLLLQWTKNIYVILSRTPRLIGLISKDRPIKALYGRLLQLCATDHLAIKIAVPFACVAHYYGTQLIINK